MLAYADQHALVVKKRKEWTPIHGEVLPVGSAGEPSSNKSRSGSQAEEANSQGSKRARTSSRPLDDSLAGKVLNGVSAPLLLRFPSGIERKTSGQKRDRLRA